MNCTALLLFWPIGYRDACFTRNINMYIYIYTHYILGSGFRQDFSLWFGQGLNQRVDSLDRNFDRDLDKDSHRGWGRPLDRAFDKALDRDMNRDSHGDLDRHI